MQTSSNYANHLVTTASARTFHLARCLTWLLLLLAIAHPCAAAPGEWEFTGNLDVPRLSHTATLLPNGKVLIAAGGSNQDGVADTAELYDPVSGTWAYTGRLTTSRNYHSATLLSSGKVLVAGGYYTPARLASAEVYDPVSGTWHVTGSLSVARSSHSAVLLHDGRVLVAAGVDGTTVAELYDPATGTWSETGSLSTTRNDGQTMTVLADGKVLIVGGLVADTYLATAEVYDPATGLWTPTGSLTTGGRQYHTATLLPNGQVLVAGGYNPAIVIGALSSAELYDPASGTWRATGSLNIGHRRHRATLLPNGQVLVASGQFLSQIKTAEIYDPATETWTVTGSLNTGRIAHSATLLPDGHVLVAGGSTTSTSDSAGPGTRLLDPPVAHAPDFVAFDTAELYDSGLTPATKVNGRGSIDGQGDEASFALRASQSGNRSGGTLSFSDPAAGVSIAKATIRTHTFSEHGAELGGNAKLGDGAAVTFNVSVSDNGGGSSDTFSISLSNGYSAGGTLTSGDIQIQ
jgi:N-acetylneuraminic acid mutarotase